MARLDLGRYMELLQEEIRIVSATLRDKGAKRFVRAIVVGVALPFAAYRMSYVPGVNKLEHLDAELKAASDLAKNTDAYNEIKDRLSAAYSHLPLPKDRSDWLSETIKAAMRSEGVVSSQFTPPTEEESNGVVVQRMNITITVKFPELLALLSRLESSKPLLNVASVELVKRAEPIGDNDVVCGFSTMILTERY